MYLFIYSIHSVDENLIFRCLNLVDIYILISNTIDKILKYVLFFNSEKHIQFLRELIYIILSRTILNHYCSRQYNFSVNCAFHHE